MPWEDNDFHWVGAELLEKFGKSQSIERREDDRFIIGAGRYVCLLYTSDAADE